MEAHHINQHQNLSDCQFLKLTVTRSLLAQHNLWMWLSFTMLYMLWLYFRKNFATHYMQV